jgi:hypothetical protein
MLMGGDFQIEIGEAIMDAFWLCGFYGEIWDVPSSEIFNY